MKMKPWKKTTKLSLKDIKVMKGLILNMNYAARYGFKRKLIFQPRLRSMEGKPKQHSFGTDYKLAKLRRKRK